jgi:hypothetical protein
MAMHPVHFRGSPLSPNDFAHGLAAGGLQWSEAAPREEPYAFIFVAAVNNIDAIAHHGVVKCGTRILCNEPEERLTPGIIRIAKDLVPKLLQFFNADGTDRLRKGFAPLFIKIFKVKFFEWHRMFSSVEHRF